MEEFLTNQSSACHVMWTSSNSARTVDIDMSDIQDAQGSVHDIHKNIGGCVCERKFFAFLRLGSYPRSKKLMDIATLALNRRLNGCGLYFTSTCPGLVVSQMTRALFPHLLWYLLIPVLFLVSYT